MTFNIEELETFTALNCPNYDASLISRIFVLTRFSSIAITLIMYFSGIWYRELYLLIFGIGLSLDSLLNTLLQNIIEQPVPNEGCGGEFGMPSELSQHILFFYTMLVTFPILYTQSAGIVNIAIVTLVTSFVCAAQVHLGYNDSAQVAAGAVIGSTFGFVYQMIVFLTIYPRFNWILDTWLISAFGYIDSWCRFNMLSPQSGFQHEFYNRATFPKSHRKKKRIVEFFIRAKIWPVLKRYIIFQEDDRILLENVENEILANECMI